MRIKYELIIIMLLISFSTAFGDGETLYPSKYDIGCRYNLSSTIILISDTLEITRMVGNNEDFALYDLYLSDNLPAEFEIISSRITIDGNPAAFYFSDGESGQVIEGYNGFRWVIDFPSSPDSLDNILEPGERLLLKYRIICASPGNYCLPFHSASFYGNGTGFFTVSDSLFVTVLSENMVPALSEWGMIILALLLIAASTAAVIRGNDVVLAENRRQ